VRHYIPALSFTAAVASDMEMGPNLVVSAMNVMMHAYNLGKPVQVDSIKTRVESAPGGCNQRER
jgi:hypothetical protein